VAEESDDILKIGWLSDIHLGTNCHEEKMPPLADEVLKKVLLRFVKAEVDLVVVTGDMIDDYQMEKEQILDFHRQVRDTIKSYDLEAYYVLGNHDVCDVSKEEVVEIYDMPDRRYAFDKKGITFIAIDTQFNQDGSSYSEDKCFFKGFMPQEEINWLEGELGKTNNKVVVLAHQPLNKVGKGGEEAILGAEKVRRVLEESGQVKAVLSGHYQPRAGERKMNKNDVEYLILSSPIFEKTRFSHAIIRLDTQSGEFEIDRFRDGATKEKKFLYEEYKEEYDGKDEEMDYEEVSKIKNEKPEEFERMRKLFETYLNKPGFRDLSEEEQEKVKDFEDYRNYKKYLGARKAYKGY
jgi:alkaline phosphatase